MHHAITLEALRVLEAINQKGSFAEAAKSLFKVPSALTYTINKLETDLEVELFDRSKQRASLTQAGQLLLKEGHDLLLAATRLEEQIKQVESGWETKLVIAKDTIINNQPLLEILARFCSLEKQVDITILEEALGGGWDALHSKRSDIAIGVTGELPKGQYQVESIGEIEFVFVVAQGHPLTKFLGILDTQQIKQFPAVVVSDSSRHLPQRSSGLFDSKQTIRVQDMQTKLDALIKGLGVGFMPIHLVTEQLSSGELISLTTSLPRPPIPIYIAWEKGKKGKALNWFIEQCKQQIWL